MTYPALLRQPNWVLQSASADRPGPVGLNEVPDEAALVDWTLIKPGWDAYQRGEIDLAKGLWRYTMTLEPQNLLLLRAINQYAPDLLDQKKVYRLKKAPRGNRIAVILSGELRCIQKSKSFLRSIKNHADIFICTTNKFTDAAEHIAATKIEFVDIEPNHEVGAMQQWHKLYMALSMIRSHEKNIGRQYTHIIKLRSDYYHVQPRNLLIELVSANGLICSSDKVFGGRRELMMLFEGFYKAIDGWFDQQEQNYWPINVNAILNSDDSCKWYGMNFPKQLVGQPKTVEQLRSILTSGGKELARDLQRWSPTRSNISNKTTINQMHRHICGHPRFASEICFARFLNFNGITTKSSPGLLGFLRSDRSKA